MTDVQAPRFSGSYPPDDVHFLLRPVDITPLPVVEKEKRILSGNAHYAEMLSEETLPDASWRAVVEDALTRHGLAMARRHRRLATLITERVHGAITVVSLARAGTPTGVVLTRLLRHIGRPVQHYSISLVLGRGLDRAALDYIRERHPDDSIFFVDGWTGKGSIASELRTSLQQYRALRHGGPAPRLAVLCDLARVADVAADGADALIPHALLGAVGSGLISRTVLSTNLVGPGQFHACRYYAEWHPHDLSVHVADRMTTDALSLIDAPNACAEPNEWPAFVPLADWLALRRPHVTVHDVKPGICESIRALLRRTPRTLLLRQPDHPDVTALRILAARTGVPIEIVPDLPHAAMTIIRRAPA